MRISALAGLSAAAPLLLIGACASDDPPTIETTPEAVAEAPSTPAERDRPAGSPPEAAAPSVTTPPAVTARPDQTGDGLGLSENELLAVFANGQLDPEAFENVDLGDGRRVTAASFPASTQRQVLWVAMFGGDEPHTVRVDYFPGNAQGGEGETVGEALSGLMSALFPDWSEAGTWPERAGARAWQETVKAAEEGPGPGGGARVPILESERDGVWLGALGVPPNVVSYVFTTSEACRPSVASTSFYQGYVGCG